MLPLYALAVSCFHGAHGLADDKFGKTHKVSLVPEGTCVHMQSSKYLFHHARASGWIQARKHARTNVDAVAMSRA